MRCVIRRVPASRSNHTVRSSLLNTLPRCFRARRFMRRLSVNGNTAACCVTRNMGLRFHWMLPKGGEVTLDGVQTPLEAARYRIESMSTASLAPKPDLKGWTHFARHAERSEEHTSEL